MDSLGLGLSDGFRLSVIASYAVAIKRYGTWGRAIALAIMLFGAGLFAYPSWRIVQLSPLLVGLALAWVDAHPDMFARLEESPRLRWLAIHFTASRTVAAVNIGGLLEGIGALAAGLFFAGPQPVSMPTGIRATCLVALTAFAWNAFSQVAADPGYYNTDPPPARWAVVGRWLLPALASVVAYVFFIGVGAYASATPAVPWWEATLLAGSFLLIWPYIGTLNALLRYASVSAKSEIVRNLEHLQGIHHEYVHRAKNELRPNLRDVASDAEYDAYSDAVVIVENARRDIDNSTSTNFDDAHPVGELWDRYQSTIGDPRARSRLHLIDKTNGRKLSHMEGLILQSIFVSFVSNALRASPVGRVTINVSEGIDENYVPRIRVLVEDDGMGDAPSVFKQGSSLARLNNLCNQFGGGIQVESRESRGTCATATFACYR